MRLDALLHEVATRANLSLSQAALAFHALADITRETVRSGEAVVAPGFGRWDIDGFVWYGSCSLLPRCKVEDEREGWGEDVDAVAEYLRENYDPEGFFGIGQDMMPGSSLSPVAYEEDIVAQASRLARQPSLTHIVAEILS